MPNFVNTQAINKMRAFTSNHQRATGGGNPGIILPCAAPRTTAFVRLRAPPFARAAGRPLSRMTLLGDC